MGRTAGDDPLTLVELTFDTREQAVACANREGLAQPREIASGRIEVDRLRDDLIGRFSRIDRDMPFGGPPPGWLAPGSWPGGSREDPSGGKAPERVH